MSRPLRLLDVFSGAGGCSVGYHRAGFTDITGVDNRPMPRYPFTFIQADALEFLAGVKQGEYDLIHASPPCQAYVDSADRERHPRLIEPVRARLLEIGTPYVIENVDRAPLVNAFTLCGTMFGLRVIRHRLFECRPFPPVLVAPCCHWGTVAGGDFAGVYGHGSRGARYTDQFGRTNRWGRVPEGKTSLQFFRESMGIDWMTRKEITQAIPPAYCEFIGRRLIPQIGATP